MINGFRFNLNSLDHLLKHHLVINMCVSRALIIHYVIYHLIREYISTQKNFFKFFFFFSNLAETVDGLDFKRLGIIPFRRTVNAGSLIQRKGNTEQTEPLSGY